MEAEHGAAAPVGCLSKLTRSLLAGRSKALAVASCQFCMLAAALLHRKICLVAGWLFLQLTPVVSPLSLACGVRVRCSVIAACSHSWHVTCN